MKIALVLDSVCWGLFDEQDGSSPDYLNDPRYQVVAPEYADSIAVGWVLSDGVWSAPQAPEPVSADFGRIITVLAYSSRFTQAEEIAIETAAQSGGVAGAAASLALRKLGWAGYINLDEPRTIAATQSLESVGLIGAGRAAEILGPPVYSTELLAESRRAYGLPVIPTPAEFAANGGKGWATPAEAGLYA